MVSADEEASRLKTELEMLKEAEQKREAEIRRLRVEQSQLVRGHIDREEEMRRQISLLECENQFQQNQRPLASSMSSESQLSLVGMRFALKDFFKADEVCTPSGIERSKFFHDYFFDEFYSIDINRVIQTVQKEQPTNELFVRLFLIFGSRKEYFDLFYERFFSLVGFPEEQQHALEGCPIEWLLDETQTFRNAILQFINYRRELLFSFFIKLADSWPSLLPQVFPCDAFDAILSCKAGQWRQLARAFCKSYGQFYITPKNFHLIPQDALKLYYGDLYIDLSPHRSI